MQTKEEKGILSLLLTFLVVIGVLAGVYRPIKNAHAAEDFRRWRQLDNRWGDTAIGGTTVRKSGCYITSIAMVAVASGARTTDNFNPGVFAKTLSSMGAFNQWGGLSSWASVNRAVPEISIATANINFRSGDQSGKAKEIKEYLDKGYYVICNVGGHWVYIDGVIGNDVYMADPAKDEILMFKAYSNGNITCYQAIRKKNPYKGFTPLNAKPTTTTTTSTTTVTTATTTAAQNIGAAPLAPVKRPESYVNGEYFCFGSGKVKVLADISDEKSTIAELKGGSVIEVLGIDNGYGEVCINGKKGWADLSELEYVESEKQHEKGDVNYDGSVDAYDLALINEYINSCDDLPEGVSVLTRAEKKAADISGDGKIDNTDVLMYLMLICK